MILALLFFVVALKVYKKTTPNGKYFLILYNDTLIIVDLKDMIISLIICEQPIITYLRRRRIYLIFAAKVG